ncbi:hypothetical protein GCM10010435_87510 [Winogradskya consettensis]|uniref:Protein kinase domain-containing protein n=1 Tax=Winogradskya consettensis TaxID=113560 RepID=A0A919T0Y6_9ACTN|nr:serine/threonine-protein kinase [Actinoplanes consettensis]GIM80942.1 hypothetical protein Aco04nite_73790 [Actinoplanes consettensis]
MSKPLRPGDPTRLGRYDLVGRLGQGGMGTVFLGRAADGSAVAIKMVRPEFADDPEFRGRFRSEVNRAKQVPPFSTAEVLDADPDHDPPYLVVEFVDGPSLQAVISQKGPLTGSALHGVAVGIATALTAIHGAGVIHRDLKPGNVLIAMGGIKVIDFGIARAFEATSAHTRTDQMVGTVAYMAPERLDPEFGKDLTSAADVFAWGVVVTYAASGHTPFTADSAAGTAVRILTRPPDTADVPEPLRDLVERALAKRPEERPTARELLDALLGSQTLSIRQVAAVVPPPDDTSGVNSTPPPRPRRWRRAVLASAAAVALVIGGVLGLHRANSGGGEPEAGSTTPASTILAGERAFSIQLATGNRYFMLDTGGAELEVSDGTGSASQFVLEPVGVDYLIRSLSNEGRAGADICLGVKITPGENARPVVGTGCTPTKGTLFSVSPTGDKDARGRPAYRIGNEYGFLQWDADAKRSEVEEVGEATYADSYSLIDRGELPDAPPSTAPTSAAPTSAAPATSGPKLVDADLSALEGLAIDFGVPVVIVTSGDAGAEYHLDGHPDGTVDFSGTAVTETTRMTIKPAKVRKRTEDNSNHVVIASATGTKLCVTDTSKLVLRMEQCRPGDATQSWKMSPAGDSGLFELSGEHTPITVDQGKITDDGYAALSTIAVKP